MLQAEETIEERDTRRLTNGGLHNHGIRVTGAQAVPSSVDRLHSKHVVCSSDQTVAHEPADSDSFPLLNICSSNSGSYNKDVIFAFPKSLKKWNEQEK